MKKSLILAVLLILTFQGVGQTTETKARNNVISLSTYLPFVSLNYDRYVPLGERFGLIGTAGLLWYDGPIPLLAASVYTGSARHRVELGGTLVAFELPLIHLAYRYTGSNGFFAKVGLGYMPGEEGAPILGLGYSF